MPFKDGNKHGSTGAVIAKKRKQALINELLGVHVQKAVAVIHNDLNSSDPACYQWAAKLVIEYCYGKPAQQVTLSGEASPLRLIIEEKEK